MFLIDDILAAIAAAAAAAGGRLQQPQARPVRQQAQARP